MHPLNNRIVFQFSIGGIGGVQVLYLNIIKRLNTIGINVKLLYLRDTWLTQQLDLEGIKYKLFDIVSDDFNELNKFIFPEDIILTTNDFSLPQLHKIKPYFFYWVVFPRMLATINKENLYGRLSNFLRPYWIKKMIKNNGLVFMDEACALTNQKINNLKFNNMKYLPIPVNSLYSSESSKYPKSESKNISYIGRAENWKVNPLKKILNDLLDTNLSHEKYIFHIFTDNTKIFKNLLYENNDRFSNLNLVFYENIFGAELFNKLNNINLSFAMGTSALESSSIKIPTVLVDASFNEIRFDYKYKWLYESLNFTLGYILDDDYVLNNSGKSIGEALSILDHEKLYNEIANSCQEYVLKSHSLDTITNNLVNYLMNCKNKTNPNLNYYLKNLITK